MGTFRYAATSTTIRVAICAACTSLATRTAANAPDRYHVRLGTLITYFQSTPGSSPHRLWSLTSKRSGYTTSSCLAFIPHHRNRTAATPSDPQTLVVFQARSAKPVTMSDEELDRDWKPSGRRPQSCVSPLPIVSSVAFAEADEPCL